LPRTIAGRAGSPTTENRPELFDQATVLFSNSQPRALAMTAPERPLLGFSLAA